MAATRLIPLHVNKGKTIAQSLGDRTDYASNPEKTGKGELVSGYMCDPMTVDEEFLLSKRQYHQITGRESRHDVIAYQIRQSFKPGEITPEDANKLGRELALRFTKGKFAFIVATHTDRAHIHNHIIFNSTSLDATRKFKNFWLSSIALQRISDLICLEHGLSVIKPKPYRERHKRTEYPKKENLRDGICRDMDAVLQSARPNSFEEFLQDLEKSGYEIKRGKQIAVKGKQQKRFIRLSSLREGYTEADLRAYLESEGARKRPSVKTQKHSPADRPFNLIIDIQTKLQFKDAGYRRWATVYNLKQMAKTLLFLRDHQIASMDQLEAMVHARTEKRNDLLSRMQTAEKRLTEISTLRTHIINYSKTRPIYEAYRKAGYSKKFLEEHREEISLHKAAKQAFDALELQKIPRIKELSAEYGEILSKKKQLYHEYRKVKDEVQELLIAQKNIASLYDAERKDEAQRYRKQEQSH
ncbi:MAG: relaxase/mobilization nuclease domain-containing protein [Eubacterium sp.]